MPVKLETSSTVPSSPAGSLDPPLDAPLDPRDEAACLPTERLEAEITRLAGHLAAAECRWLLLVAEFDRREGWRTWGCSSLAHWLGWQCGLDQRAARERIRVARALLRYSAIREEFAAGRLSYSKVRAITRIVTPESEAGLVSMARHATAAQIERLVAGYRRAFDPQRRAGAEELHRRREVTWFHDDDRAWVQHSRLDPEDGAFVRGVLDALTERSIRTRPLDPGETRAMRRADALVEMAAFAARAVEQAATSGDATPLPVADRHLVVVNVDASVLAEGEGTRCELDGGPGLAAETARRLACDATVVPVVRGPDGDVVGIGVRRRNLPRWLRRMLHARDGGCRFPGCGERRLVHGHHVRHWTQGGPTVLSNLVELCAHHHRLAHEGSWSVLLGVDGTVTFTDPHGRSLADHSAGGSAEPPDPATIEHTNADHGVSITPTTIVPHWYGDRLDLDLALTALMPRPTRAATQGGSAEPPG